ncbi:MAG: hypothetical protein ACYDB7_14855 [Mycobacteriales bacterium]
MPRAHAVPPVGALRPLARALLAAAAEGHARHTGAALAGHAESSRPAGRPAGLPSPRDNGAWMDCPAEEGA